MILAADPVNVAQWIVAGVITPTALAVLFLTGRVVTAAESERRVQAERDRRDAEREAWNRGMAALEERLAAVLADRDAWRAAHKEETEARAAAERAASNLMGATDMSVQLLAALQEALRGRDG